MHLISSAEIKISVNFLSASWYHTVGRRILNEIFVNVLSEYIQCVSNKCSISFSEHLEHLIKWIIDKK